MEKQLIETRKSAKIVTVKDLLLMVKNIVVSLGESKWSISNNSVHDVTGEVSNEQRIGRKLLGIRKDGGYVTMESMQVD